MADRSQTGRCRERGFSPYNQRSVARARDAFHGGRRNEREQALTSYRIYRHAEPFAMHLGGTLQGFQIAYETWGELSPRADNAILLTTGLSPGSHAKSHAGAPEAGWWEEFIGPGLALDTNRFFVICTNVLGGCYGSTGPSSTDPATGRPYALSFPSLTIEDMVAAQQLLVRSLGIEKLHAVVGSSMGGMQSLAHAALYPGTVGSIVVISAAGRSYPWSIAIRFVQRQAVLADPDWNGGNYYGGTGPLNGLHVARQLGTISYRGPGEWEPRFGRERVDHPLSHTDEGHLVVAPDAPKGRGQPGFPDRPGAQAALAHRFGVDFQIESYLAHQGDKFVRRFDTNSYLYISKAMDLFDLGEGQASFAAGLGRITARSLVVGVPTDLLFPIRLQEEIAEILTAQGRDCRFRVLDSIYGHDSFLVEVAVLTPMLKEFLET